MGKLEKVVVLTVLFLVAVILGVSLNADKGVAEASGPLARPLEEPEPETVAAKPEPKTGGRRAKPPGVAQPSESAAGSNAPMGPAGVLSATVGGDAASEAPTTPPAVDEAEQEPPTFIKTLAGLEPSLSEDLMIYTWKHGDTLTSLADLYYGSRLHVARLRGANEGRRESDLIAGDRILVPVLPPLESEAPDAGEESEWEGGSTYTVQSGDVLGTISQTVYGTSKSWRKIFDANRDVLVDANSLTVGMVLRIPE